MSNLESKSKKSFILEEESLRDFPTEEKFEDLIEEFKEAKNQVSEIKSSLNNFLEVSEDRHLKIANFLASSLSKGKKKTEQVANEEVTGNKQSKKRKGFFCYKKFCYLNIFKLQKMSVRVPQKRKLEPNLSFKKNKNWSQQESC